MKLELSELGRHEAYLRLYNILTSLPVIKDKRDEYLILERKLAADLISHWKASYTETLKNIFNIIPDNISEKAVEIITEGLTQSLGKKFGQSIVIRHILQSYIRDTYEKSKKEFIKEAHFNLVDSRAVEVLTKHNCFWLGEHYGKHIGPKIAEITQQALEDGAGRKELADELHQALGGEAGDYKYWDVASSAALVRARSFGAIAGMEEAGITEYEVLAMGDERTCEICGNMNGRVFSVSTAREKINSVLDIEDPEKFKEAMPWQTESPKEKSNKELLDAGMNIPPFHGRCRCTITLVDAVEMKNIFTTSGINEELELAEGLIPETAKALRDAFIDSPQFIKDLYLKYKDTLFGILIDAEKNGEYYDSDYKIIHIGEETTIRALVHEFGHHIHVLLKNTPFSDKEFVKTVNTLTDILAKNDKVSIKIQQKMEQIMMDSKAFSNAELSDIFCALVKGNINKENLWGCASHSERYYQRNENIQAEIFANIFSLYAQNDIKAINYIQDVSSDIIKAFLKMVEVSKDEEK